MNPSKKHEFPFDWHCFYSTSALLKKCVNVKNFRRRFPAVKKWNLCGVELEKFLKNLWNFSFQPDLFSQSVESANLEKVEIISGISHFYGNCAGKF